MKISISKYIDKCRGWWNNFTRARKVTITDIEGGEKVRYIHISPFNTFTAILGSVVLLFIILLFAVAYTPVLNLLPGYRTDAIRNHDLLVSSIIRIDSLEQCMEDMLTYNENMILVVDGKTPAMRTIQKDSLHLNKNLVAPSATDSLLRHQIENNPNYALVSQSPTSARHGMDTVAPTEGIISEKFNSKLGIFGVKIAGVPSAQVVAVADGTVISCDWIPDSGNCITIQHTSGLTSIYRRLTSTLTIKGQPVKSGQVIGVLASGKDNDEAALFEFELWSDGVAIDPESYILF